jgi:hypothetical protein
VADLSYVCGTSDQPLIDRLVGQELVRAARERPEVDAIVAVHQDVRLSYAGLVEVADRVGATLLQLGVEPAMVRIGARTGGVGRGQYRTSRVRASSSTSTPPLARAGVRARAGSPCS